MTTAARPLTGIRILAIEQMLALPYATQLLGFLGADVVKVEPLGGDSGRASRPLLEPDGEELGAVFARGNIGKRSIAVDLKSDRGRELVLRLVPHFDIVAENLRPGALERLGLGFDVLTAARPDVVLLRVSGFGSLDDSPYRTWPAYGPVVESMAGLTTLGRTAATAHAPGTFGALGDIAGGIFAALSALAALRQRDNTGQPQYADIAMLDATMAFIDAAPMIAALGLGAGAVIGGGTGLTTSFAARDGRFMIWCIREHMFTRLAVAVGHPEWQQDPRLARREQWAAALDDVLRPGIEAWAADLGRLEAAARLAEAGVAAGPVTEAGELARDPHVISRGMLVGLDHPAYAEPLPVVGNPVRLQGVEPVRHGRVPHIGEHTSDVLTAELGLRAAELLELESAGVIGGGAWSGAAPASGTV